MNNQIVASNQSAWSKFQALFFSPYNKNPRRKLFNTLWAVLFGFIVSGLVISFSGFNPFEVFAQIFQDGTTIYGNKLISIFIAYLIAALAVAICFKSGLFNIGISGQMMIAGFTTLLIFKKLSIEGGYVILAMFVAIIMGALLSLIAASLKVYFGINEVVSTIMLNWIVFFIIKYLVQDVDGLATPDSLASNLSDGYIMPQFFQPSDLSMSWYSNNYNWILLSIAVILIAGITIIFSRTSFGYKIKMVGLNKDAADYSGTNKKSLILIVMVISGALSGLAGFIWYVGSKGQIDISEQPLTAGFDAIAISLLAYNNPIGIGLSSFIYGIMNVGTAGTHSQFVGLPKEINEVVVGLMVYIAAISVVFTKLNGARWIKNFFILSKNQKYRNARVESWNNNLYFFFSWFSVHFKILSISMKHNSQWKKIKKQHRLNIKTFEHELLNKYKHKTKIFNVEIMSDDDQINYFNKIAKLKKETDFELAKNHYFDKNNIKGQRVEKYRTKKHQFQKIKDNILAADKLCVDVVKTIKKSKKEKYATQMTAIEETLIISWKELNQIDLKQQWIKQTKVQSIKEMISNNAKELKLTNLLRTIQNSVYTVEGGK